VKNYEPSNLVHLNCLTQRKDCRFTVFAVVSDQIVVFCVVTPRGVADGVKTFVEVYRLTYQGRTDWDYRSQGIVLGRKIQLALQERWLGKFRYKCLRYRVCIKWWTHFSNHSYYLRY
jgi:hypothetical protein